MTGVQLQATTRTDPVLSKVLRYTRDGWPSEVEGVFRSFWRRREELSIEKGCLLWGI